MNKKAKASSSWYIIIAIIAIAVMVSPTGKEWLGSLGTIVSDDGTPDEGVITYKEVGNAATLYIDAYTGSWGGVATKTEVAPSYTIQDSTGQVIVADTTADSLASYVGESIDIYGTGASYYFDPVKGYQINNAAPRVAVEVYAIPTTANMDVIVYDETGSNALTADDHDNNTADYAGGDLGAGETYTYYAKFETKVVDRTFRLGAICTFYCGGEVNNFALEESNWIEVNVPNGKLTDTFTMKDDTNISTACSYKKCYVPSNADYVELGQWDDVKYEFLIDTDDSTAPSANGDSYVGAVFLDYGCEVEAGGDVVCDWYKHDANNDPGEIGLDENPETAPYGLDCSFGLEPQ